mmetsp:Transcript_8374/g.15861  ORF Transcript_8374/g.15861 Transcript_8374/m.15861 type:complete len:496 (+) Transcript_8374:1520-3007(+)
MYLDACEVHLGVFPFGLGVVLKQRKHPEAGPHGGVVARVRVWHCLVVRLLELVGSAWQRVPQHAVCVCRHAFLRVALPFAVLESHLATLARSSFGCRRQHSRAALGGGGGAGTEGAQPLAQPPREGRGLRPGCWRIRVAVVLVRRLGLVQFAVELEGWCKAHLALLEAGEDVGVHGATQLVRLHQLPPLVPLHQLHRSLPVLSVRRLLHIQAVVHVAHPQRVPGLVVHVELLVPHSDAPENHADVLVAVLQLVLVRRQVAGHKAKPRVPQTKQHREPALVPHHVPEAGGGILPLHLGQRSPQLRAHQHHHAHLQQHLRGDEMELVSQLGLAQLKQVGAAGHLVGRVVCSQSAHRRADHSAEHGQHEVAHDASGDNAQPHGGALVQRVRHAPVAEVGALWSVSGIRLTAGHGGHMEGGLLKPDHYQVVVSCRLKKCNGFVGCSVADIPCTCKYAYRTRLGNFLGHRLSPFPSSHTKIRNPFRHGTSAYAGRLEQPQ